MLSLQQHINKIAELFFQLGGHTAVICPGSRNVPLMVAFTRHEKIKCIPVSDERSAGFIALGIAQQTQQPVAIICTSGTATLNFYPAICEAFYQQIPLVVITADRPPEIIDQWDGQAIRQNDIFKNHILKQITIPHTLDESSMLVIESEVRAVIELGSMQKLPVHINVPLKEPFYPSPHERYTYNEERIKVGNPSLLSLHSTAKDSFSIEVVFEQIRKIVQAKNRNKVLVIIGMNHFSEDVMLAIQRAQQKISFPLITDVISNYGYDDSLINYDFVLDEMNQRRPSSPDILITIGGPLLSKNLKKYIRSNKPLWHCHIQSYGQVGDPFQSLTSVLRVAPRLFFEELAKMEISVAEYRKEWCAEEEKIILKQEVDKLHFCELKAAQKILQSLPLESNLQLANSMPIRYGLLFGIKATIKVNGNRGTSGIDGCSSTAVGAALASQKMTTLITGDMAFFYDVNAFWNTFSMPNLRIIVLNNGGGGIFRLIDGPSKLLELEAFIEVAHLRTAANIAKDFGFEYLKATNEIELDNVLASFYIDAECPKILEVFTNKTENVKGYSSFKSGILSQLLNS